MQNNRWEKRWNTIGQRTQRTASQDKTKQTDYKYKMDCKVWRWVEIKKHSSAFFSVDILLSFDVIFISRNQNENNHANTNRNKKNKKLEHICIFLAFFLFVYFTVIVDVCLLVRSFIRSFIRTFVRPIFHQHIVLRFDFMFSFQPVLFILFFFVSWLQYFVILLAFLRISLPIFFWCVYIIDKYR